MARIDADKLGDVKERIIRTNRVQKTNKGGRTLSFSTLVVVGDRNGHVGAGMGKARGVPDSIRKGTEDAKKNMIAVPIINGTIPHEVLAQHGATQVLLRPAAPGTGVVAGGAVRILLEEAGVQDVLAKSLGSNNPVNNAWATIKALKALRTIEQVAALRGKTPSEIVRGSSVQASAILGGQEMPVVRPVVLEAVNDGAGATTGAAESGNIVATEEATEMNGTATEGNNGE